MLVHALGEVAFLTLDKSSKFIIVLPTIATAITGINSFIITYDKLTFINLLVTQLNLLLFKIDLISSLVISFKDSKSISYVIAILPNVSGSNDPIGQKSVRIFECE